MADTAAGTTGAYGRSFEETLPIPAPRLPNASPLIRRPVPTSRPSASGAMTGGISAHSWPGPRSPERQVAEYAGARTFGASYGAGVSEKTRRTTSSTATASLPMTVTVGRAGPMYPTSAAFSIAEPIRP